MVNFIKRDNDDIYSKPIMGFLFKNQKFLLTLKIVVLALFLYALYFGFAHTGKDNTFTYALFWGIFWSLFMVATLPTFGRIFCGICPHGFMGKYITKFGLKKKMPKWMQNRYIGLFLLVFGWWGIYYMFPGVYRTPLGTATLFTVMTLISFMVYFVYRDMSYCKYICPIGVLTRAYSKLSFTWLGTYKSACNECKTFECATACPHGLKPFTFDSRNSMTDCTLCMDCSAACEAVSFKYKKPSFSLFSKFQILKAEVWAYILILASIPITMSFHHGIGRSNAADDMIWSKTAEFFKGFMSFGSVDPIGLFAFLYAMLFTISAALIGMLIASKILQKDFSKVFYDLGYSYAPLFILGSLAHSLETFFMRGYKQIVEGFAHGFGFDLHVLSLAQRGDSWLHVFGLLKWVAITWALIILYKRMKLLDADKMRKIIAYPFAASLIVFFLSVNMYRAYIIDTYGRASGDHRSHKVMKNFNTHTKGVAKKVTATDIIYFTDKNPVAKKSSAWNGSYMQGGARREVPSKKVWPVFKNESDKLNCIRDIHANLYLLDTNLEVTKVKQSKGRGCKSVSFKMPNNGYYNLFYSDSFVQKNTLYTSTAKYEYMRFNHSNDAVYDEQKMSAHTIKEIPFDILRLREDGETFYHRLYSGDNIRIKAILNSKPIEGASIKLSTETGWSKTIKTGKDGIATFILLKDYFPEWNKFDRRHKNKFLLTATYTQKIKGEYLYDDYEKIKHTVTYPSMYYPNSSAYKSYAYGLLAAVVTMLLSGVAIYWYRRRNYQPFKEVRFDEKD